MKNNLILVSVFLVLTYPSKAQSDSTQKIDYKNRYGIFTTPVSKNTQIDGVAIGLLMSVPWRHADYLKIDGLNLEISPFGAIGAPLAFIASIFSPFNRDTSDHSNGDLGSYNIFPEKNDTSSTLINGLSVSIGGTVRETKINGVTLNGLINFGDCTNGFELTGFMNLHHEFNGIIIAGFRNKTTTGKGVQIGLFNTCKSGRLIQLGLLNRIGKRVTPFINFSFKKNKA